MGRALVVYGTKSGCTKGIAEAIGDGLRRAGVTADVVAVEEKPDPSAYDAVIVGSGVRAGNWHGAVRTWVTAQAEALKARPTAFFTACLTMHSNPEKANEVRAYTVPLIAETGVRPVDVGLFAGMNLPKTFSLPERLVMKAMKAPEGDFRDLDAAAEWGTAIAPTLGLTD